MHLAERGRGGRLEIEAPEAVLPVEPEFRGHPAAHEGGAHGRRVVLQFREFGCIFGRNGIRDGRQQLRDLHQRALEAAERLGEAAALAASPSPPNNRVPAIRAANPADIGADPRVTGGAGREAVLFLIGHGARCAEWDIEP